MQLRFKKTILLSTIIVYCASFLLQSNFVFFQTWAAENNTPRVNIVAILVDDKIYDSISSWLKWYATDYVQKQLSDTKALVMPLNLSKISAYDIHRMMENIYFDWLEDVNSSLIWLIMFWDIPFPVVNQNWYIFPTVYPYVDFENQKYVWDADLEYFVPNGNLWGEAEIWHWLINYWSDANAIIEYQEFFDKVKKYNQDPNWFIWSGIRYEDFIASKEWFLNENYPYYRNKIMFGEDISYQRYSPLMKKLFFGESTDNSVDIVSGLWEAVESAWGNAEQIKASIDEELIEELKDLWGEGLHTTKMIQQEIENSFLADYDDLFSNTALSIMRENVLAWWRWLKVNQDSSGQANLLADVNSSSSMIQLKDTMYLWNQNLQWLLENLNELMEDMIDKKIEEQKYSMDIVVPLEYKEVTWKRIDFKCYSLVNRFENYYFGNNVRFIDNSEDLSIYRGTYRNLLNLDWVTYDSLLTWNNPVLSELDKTDFKLKSIWWSYGIFSSQAEWNRWYAMMTVDQDLDVYEENKTVKNMRTEYKSVFGRLKKRTWPEICREDSKRKKYQCEWLNDFAQRWWWWASSINLISESAWQWRYELSWYIATDSWRPIYGMWWFQSLLSGEDEWINGTWWINWTWVWPQTAATSFNAYVKYSSPTQREWWWETRWLLIGKWYEIYEDHKPDVHMDFSDMDYWNLSSDIISTGSERKFSKESEKIFNIDYVPVQKVLKCWWSEKYSYKVINSVVKHDSTNEDEINWIDRDKYGENWTLWVYYRDIKWSYDEVKNDMWEIIKMFPELLSGIDSSVNFIKSKINQLDEEWTKLSTTKEKISNITGSIESLNKEISWLESDVKSLQNQISQYQMSEDDYEEEISSLQSQITWIRNSISKKRSELSNLQWQLNLAENDKHWSETNIGAILNEVSDRVSGSWWEKDQVTDVYKLMMSLYVENIIGTIEYIIYLEWGNPDEYYLSWTTESTDLKKIWFLPSWISEIKNVENSIKVDSKDIIKYYDSVYSWVNAQKVARWLLASKLKSLSDENWDEIDKVSEEINNLLTLTETDEDWEVITVTLTWWTARSEMGNLYDDLGRVSELFWNFIEEDQIWPAIVNAALQDSDFRLWLMKKWIDYQSFSDEDWIIQYASWTRWDGYDSTWAIVNHDLLLWVSEHMSWMNLLTPDRPIDSPRYVTMQSIAWNEMKFIYPDLFNVEVFALSWQNKSWYDIHLLLTWWQIKEKLIEYLSWKVEEYNKILQSEYEKAGTGVGDKDSYYNRLESLGFNLATPNKTVRPYGYFTYEDFLNAIWWTWMLDTISDMLYYQSLTNKKKLSTWMVQGDIELIKQSFSLNDKREQTLIDYLTEWNEEIKNPLLVIPMYELSWYEVAYVNSDWRDYIIPTEVDMDTSFNDNTTVKIRRHQPAQEEEDFKDECGIPKSWRLLLIKLEGWELKSPWLKWFKCWWEYTKAHPAKIEMTFDRSIWEVIVWSWFKAFMDSLWKSIFSDTAESFTQWWDAMSKYADKWESIVSPETWHDSDKDIVQEQVEAEKHNQEAIESSVAASILGSNIKISNSNEVLSDNNPSSLLKIESLSDVVGNVKVVFTCTWDWAVNVGGVTLKTGQSTQKYITKSAPFSGLIKSADHRAWKIGLDIKVYWWGGAYIKKVIKYTVTPSTLDNFEIKVYDDKTVAWMITPVEVIWYDKYNNRVDWWLEKYDFSVSQWRFLKDWAYKTWFSTNDFRKLRFYYQAPLDAVDWSKALIEISRHSDLGSWSILKVSPKNPYEQTIVQGSPVIELDWKKILEWKMLVTNQEYTLKDDESIYDDNWKLKVSKLRKLDIKIEDLNKHVVDVDSEVLVTSKNWLVYVWQVQKDWSWNDIFFETSKNYMSGGKVTVYFYPTTVAWDEVINIDIPWLETREINLTIRPGRRENIQLVLQKEVLYLWEAMDIELFLSDKWWNLIDSDWYYKLYYDEDKIEFIDPNSWHDWEISVVYRKWYGRYKIFGTGAWLAFIQAGSKPTYFNVDKHIFPDSGLNIMYLNYFWNDWWNQWWYLSDNNKHVEELMKKSNKIITTTTQLVSEDKIKKMVWRMEPWLKIWNPDNVNTLMSIQWGKIDIMIGDITTMKKTIQSLTWTQDSNNNLGNYALFIPSDSKYSINKNWVLLNDGERVADVANWEIPLQLSTDFMSNWDNIWNLIYKWVYYGNVVLHYPSLSVRAWDFETPWDRYIVSATFTHGTTDSMSSVWLFDVLSTFELNSSYKSIQDSNDLEEKVWFLWDFKNITLFAEWEIVWEATRRFWSEFVINLWDPVLSRKWINENVYGTDYDWWIWNEIYSDPESNFFGTYEIDFNKDGNKDLLVVYLNWSIKLSKNYNWTPDLRDMQELMRIAVPIKDVFVWDVDGNKWEDIIILTTNNQLRVYLNNGGKFDVDGNVVCLNQNVFWWEVSSTPTDLEWLYEIFVEDMNKDDVVDIITYDNVWYIKVFYWWKTNWWGNYLSKEKYACDEWWYDREKGNTTVVDAFWLMIDGSKKVFDNSMLTWKWITKPEIEISEEDLEEYWIHSDLDHLEDKISERRHWKDGSMDAAVREIMDINDPSVPNYKFDVSEASKTFVDQAAKYVDVTLYESDLVSKVGDSNNYIFALSSYLDPDCAEDVWSVRKNYSTKSSVLQDGDIVTVTVTVKASDEQSFYGSFGDVIQWPWNLYYDKNNIMKSIRFTLNKWNAVIKPRDWNFAYIIDNIKLSPWQEMKFEYDLEYRSIPLREMSITYDTFYWGDDEYPDIKLQSVDWCTKDFDAYLNWWWSRQFQKTIVNLQDMINDTYKNEDESTVDYTQNVLDVWSNVNDLPWIVWDTLHRISLLNSYDMEVSNDEEGKWDLKDALLKKIEEWWFDSLNMNLNVDLSIFEDQADEIERVIDDITKWMCNGFQFGWSHNCKWLPVPFNQAFLAPWKYHLFGCWDLPLKVLEWWLPVFFFPGEMPVYPVPIPWWMKNESDDFLWVWWWKYPSFIRIYAAPTLTAQLGIAVCLLPSAVVNRIESPVADIGWNCIVFAIKPQCKDEEAPTNLENPNESFSDIVEDVRDSWVCLQSEKWPQVTDKLNNPSPLRWVSFNSSYKESNRSDVMVKESDVNNVLNDIQKLFDSVQDMGGWPKKDRVDVRKIWDNAMKGRVWDVSLSVFDALFWKEAVDKVYNKYFWDAKLSVANTYQVDYYVSADYWIMSLEREAYVAFDDDGSEWWSRNSIMIWNVDVLWWDFEVNKIKWWLMNWIQEVFIKKRLDPQIRYIASQLTRMHVDVILPDLSNLMDDELTTIKEISWKFGEIDIMWPDYSNLLDGEKEAFGGLWSMFDEYSENAKTLGIKTGQIRGTPWAGISNQTVSEFNNKIGNPFEALATLMNESNIVNITIEPLTVKVPMIFSEDINEYEFYLEQWLDENKAIMGEWESMFNWLLADCNKRPLNEQEACREKVNRDLGAFIEFRNSDWPKLVNKVHNNLMVLQKYRDFPYEIYEWMHVIDRYMSEIASLVNNTIWYLSYWVVTNAERFVWYIDAITLILNIIKTYQLIVDFSVEWSKKCGNCSRDTYDQYSCKLSFLCNSLELPIIQIPNFKLPNITVDLSNIDIWLDVVLPQFNFQPVKIRLPDIMNLPHPPSISTNIRLFNLPDIPILPDPPTLPELPSFIPEVKIELPILPPAPEIPKLPNEIEGIIKVASFIWKIYCIVKKQFGLVWEKSVKAKIEQITQRTYEVEWIDKIMDYTNWSFGPVRNYGVDYEVSAFVDLQFTIKDFYDYLDVLTKWINNLTDQTRKRSDDQIGKLENNPLSWVRDSIDSANLNLNLNIWMSDAKSSQIDLQWLTSSEVEYVDYSSAKGRLNDVLAFFGNEVNKSTFSSSIGWDINKIKNEINKPNVISWNIEWIDRIKAEVINYLDGEKMYYDDLADMINNDYDGFLAMVDSQNNENTKNSNEEKLLTFNVQLFNLDSSTKDAVNTISKSNPYRSLIENKQEIINWYWDAINNNSYDDLWMTEREYLVLRSNISSMRNGISTLYSYAVPELSTKLVARDWSIWVDKSLVASEWGMRIWSNMKVAKVIDPSLLSNWIYEKMTTWVELWKLTKVVYSDSFVKDIWNRYYDTRHFWSHDIILWDGRGIYRKCVWQECSTVRPLTSTYYSKHIDKIPYEETWLEFTKDTKLKIADWDVEVKNWKVTWQSFDLLSFSWDLSNSDAYLIKLVERIDNSYEKADYKSKGNDVNVVYVLAVPDWVELSDLYDRGVKLELISDKWSKTSKMKTIKSLYWNSLVQVVHYNPQKENARITISNVDRKWYYGRISTLDLKDNTYLINSPWSNQVVAWKQAVWDDIPPTSTQNLFRRMVNEIVSEWDNLEWFVSTNYILNVTFRDNVALSYVSISQNWNILAEQYTSEPEVTLSVGVPMYFKRGQEVYDLFWVDQYWNTMEKSVVVTFDIPTIKINDITKDVGWETVSIIAELSQDLDQWNVSFQRRRWNVWKTMKRKFTDTLDLYLVPKEKIVIWSWYSYGSEIAMYNIDDSVIALMNPNTAEITIQTGYKDSFEINVKVENSAVLYVYDKINKVNKFSVSIPTDSCVKIESDNHKVVDLDKEWNMWMFNGWKIVYNSNWDNVLMASPTCHLYSEYGLNGDYSYDIWLDAVKLTLYEPSDIQHMNPIFVWLKTKPFVAK